MGSTRRVATTFAIVAAMGVALIGVTAAVAQQDDEPVGTDPASLLARLADVEATLPTDLPPTDVTLEDEESTWGTLQGDAGSVRAVLDTLEPDLRRLFIDADDAGSAQGVAVQDLVSTAVSLVARGWLDVWQGTAALAAYESNDLAFPITGESDDGVSTGADQLRGNAVTGLELILQGRGRLLAGYVALRDLGEADPAAQALFDARAAAEEAFDQDVRPLVLRLLQQPTSSILVPTERFATSAPGVEARANSMTFVCVDREAFEQAGGVATDEVVAELAPVTPERLDCPALPIENEVRDGR